jgi:hypothetical protein
MKNLFSPKTIIALVVLYLISTGGSYAFFHSQGGSEPVSPAVNESGSTTNGFSKLNIDTSAPKTETCPLNGLKYTVVERQAWEKQRPILVMIENHKEARPQSGLSSADIVYEAVAEGGITRFMGVFYCGAQANLGKVAPVRSARIYFVNVAAEYNEPFYVHVGGANCSRDEATNQCTSNKRALAIEELAKLGWRKAKGNDFDTTSDGGAPALIRDYNRLGKDVQLATEHTMVGDLEKLWKEATKRGYTNKMSDGKEWLAGFTQWKFSDQTTKGTAASKIDFGFWDGYKDFQVNWQYDQTSNNYKRTMGNEPHIDLENKKQITASNIVIQFTKEEGPLDIHKHMLYEVIGEGKALIFQGGKAIDGKWKKASQKSRTIFTDSTGKEITFVPGQIWVEIVAKNNKIDYN